MHAHWTNAAKPLESPERSAPTVFLFLVMFVFLLHYLFFGNRQCRRKRLPPHARRSSKSLGGIIWWKETRSGPSSVTPRPSLFSNAGSARRSTTPSPSPQRGHSWLRHFTPGVKSLPNFAASCSCRGVAWGSERLLNHRVCSKFENGCTAKCAWDIVRRCRCGFTT